VGRVTLAEVNVHWAPEPAPASADKKLGSLTLTLSNTSFYSWGHLDPDREKE
jgi:hypothetical protein